MSSSQTIAKLVAELGFTVNASQLDSFLLKIKQTTEVLKALKVVANDKIQFKIGLDKTQLAGIKTEVASLGKTKVVFSDVKIADHSLRAMRVQVNTALADSIVRVSGIKPLNAKDISALQKQITNSLRTTPVVVPAGLSIAKLNSDLKAWTTKLEASFKYKLKLGVSQQHLIQSLREAVNVAGAQVATLKIKDPKVKVGIDKQHLTSEIRDALAQIRRDVKIKIDLTGHGNLSGSRGAQGGPAGWRGAAAGGVLGGAMGMGRGFIPGLGGAFAVAKLSSMSQQMQGQRAAMTAVTGSKEAGNETMNRLRGMAGEIGFSWRDVAPQFTKMIASGTSAGMGQGQVETIFKSLSEYGRVMGLDSEAMKGSFTAVEQMMNKQQIYAEELKTQLGERFPAAISMMAEAVSRKEGKKVTVAELMDMMKKGLVDSSVLKEFAEVAAERARAGGALETAKQSTAAQQQRFNNAWSLLVEKFSESGFDKLMQEFWKSAAEGLEMLQNGAKGLAQVFEMLMRPVLAFVSILKEMKNVLPEMNSGLVALAGVAALLAFPLTSTATALALIALGIEDIIYWSQGKDSLFGKLFENFSPEKQAAVLDLIDKLKAFGESIKTLATMAYDGWVKIFELFGGDNSMMKGLTTMLDLVNKIVAAMDKISKGMSITSAVESVAGPDANMASAADAGMGLLGMFPQFSLLSATYDRFKKGDEKENQLINGLDLLKGGHMAYTGNKISSIPIDQANPNGGRISVDIKLSADEITQMMGNGTFGDFMTKHSEKGVKEWMSRELGGAGARMVDYN